MCISILLIGVPLDRGSLPRFPFQHSHEHIPISRKIYSRDNQLMKRTAYPLLKIPEDYHGLRGPGYPRKPWESVKRLQSLHPSQHTLTPLARTHASFLQMP